MVKTVKGQVSLEYLMTYGIAIAIVVIAVAALYSMGVFTPSSSTVACDPCFPASTGYLTYSDYGNGELVLVNGPRELASISCNAGCSNVTDMTGTVITSVNPNQKFKLIGISTTGDVTVNITYTVKGGATHTDTATIHN